MSDKSEVFRIIDANLNRAAEGLRVVEDFARFVRGDEFLSRRFKQIRHDLTSCAGAISEVTRLRARDSQTDVGRDSDNSTEYSRESALSVAVASSKRVQQALRCLEEYGKLIDAKAARQIELLRYRTYDLEKALLIQLESNLRLQDAFIYVLIDGDESDDRFRDRLATLLAAGPRIVQFRDKNLDDRELLRRTQIARELTAKSNCLLIVNDRPDVARLSHADGVHVGQDELSVADTRRIVGPEMLIGVSTHSVEQAEQAVLAGADYIGVGPVFPSSTKSFEQFPGIDLVRDVSAAISLPAFPIGGISIRNAEEVLNAGATRVAVSSAVWGSADPAAAFEALQQIVHSHAESA